MDATSTWGKKKGKADQRQVLELDAEQLPKNSVVPASEKLQIARRLSKLLRIASSVTSSR